MSKHTPGPYYEARGSHRILICADGRRGRLELATVHPEAEYSDGACGHLPIEANARLFAAAPEMLEALKAAQHVIHPHCGDEAQDAAYAVIRAAIAKAEGRQSKD